LQTEGISSRRTRTWVAGVFPSITIAPRISVSFPASVASGERTFSALKGELTFSVLKGERTFSVLKSERTFNVLKGEHTLNVLKQGKNRYLSAV
jgi:hypothetical protein